MPNLVRRIVMDYNTWPVGDDQIPPAQHVFKHHVWTSIEASLESLPESRISPQTDNNLSRSRSDKSLVNPMVGQFWQLKVQGAPKLHPKRIPCQIVEVEPGICTVLLQGARDTRRVARVDLLRQVDCPPLWRESLEPMLVPNAVEAPIQETDDVVSPAVASVLRPVLRDELVVPDSVVSALPEHSGPSDVGDVFRSVIPSQSQWRGLVSRSGRPYKPNTRIFDGDHYA